MPAPRSSQSFCARPGCGIAKSGHGYLAGSCSNFIQPGSKEANEARRAKLSVVETPAPDTTLPIDGNVLDRVLLAGALEHLQSRIALATECLQRGLYFQRSNSPVFAQEQFQDALKALGTLGAS